MPFNKLDRLPLSALWLDYYTNSSGIGNCYILHRRTTPRTFHYAWCGKWWIGLCVEGKLLSITKLRKLNWSTSFDEVTGYSNYGWTGYMRWLVKMDGVKLSPIQPKVAASKMPDDLAKESGVNLMPSKNEAEAEVDRLKPSVDRPKTGTSPQSEHAHQGISKKWWSADGVEVNNNSGSEMDRLKTKPVGIEDWISYRDARMAEAKKVNRFNASNTKADPVEFMQQDPIGVVDRPQTTPLDRPSLTLEVPNHVALSWGDSYIKADPAESAFTVRDEAGTVAGHVILKAKADPTGSFLLPHTQAVLNRRMLSEWSNPLSSDFKSIRQMKGGELIWIGTDKAEEVEEVKAEAKADPNLNSEDAANPDNTDNNEPAKVVWLSREDIIKMSSGYIKTDDGVYADPYEAQEKP